MFARFFLLQVVFLFLSSCSSINTSTSFSSETNLKLSIIYYENGKYDLALAKLNDLKGKHKYKQQVNAMLAKIKSRE